MRKHQPTQRSNYIIKRVSILKNSTIQLFNTKTIKFINGNLSLILDQFSIALPNPMKNHKISEKQRMKEKTTKIVFLHSKYISRPSYKAISSFYSWGFLCNFKPSWPQLTLIFPQKEFHSLVELRNLSLFCMGRLKAFGLFNSQRIHWLVYKGVYYTEW